MKRALLLVALLVPSIARAEPYAALSLLDMMTPEIAVGYSARWLQVEAATFGEDQIGSVSTVNTFQEWTVRGHRLTARLRAPLTARLSLGLGLSAYDLRYEHKHSHAPSSTVSRTTGGASLAVSYRISDKVSVHAEVMHVDTPSEAFGLPDLRRARIGLSIGF